MPGAHQPRQIKWRADVAFARLSPEFILMCPSVARTSVSSERLLNPSLLIALCSVHSRRAFSEELEYNLLYCWFLKIEVIEGGFSATVCTKSR